MPSGASTTRTNAAPSACATSASSCSGTSPRTSYALTTSERSRRRAAGTGAEPSAPSRTARRPARGGAAGRTGGVWGVRAGCCGGSDDLAGLVQDPADREGPGGVLLGPGAVLALVAGGELDGRAVGEVHRDAGDPLAAAGA